MNTNAQKSALYRNPDHPRFKKIVELVQRHATLKEIGAAIGTTKERARQLIAKMKAENGDSIFQPKKRELWTTAEVAAELGTTAEIIRRLCRKNNIANRSFRRRRLLNTDELAALRNHPLVTRKKICDVCGKKFVIPKGMTSRTNTCSKTCWQEKRRREHDPVFLQKMPKPESLNGWHRELLKQLNNHQISNQEQWLTITHAHQRAGISKMQLEWLRYRHLLTIHFHSTKQWRGRPVNLYAASELDIVRQVFTGSEPVSHGCEAIGSRASSPTGELK